MNPLGSAGRFFVFGGRDAMITASELERELQMLLSLIHRLAPNDYRPEHFHDQKEALAGFTAKLLVRCGFSVPRSPRAFCAQQVDIGLARVRVNGREIRVERRST